MMAYKIKNKKMKDKETKVSEIYPEIITGKDIDKYSVSKDFSSNSDYDQDIKEAKAYAKEIDGEVYTIVDGWGTSVDFFKGVHYVDRLGYAVVKK